MNDDIELWPYFETVLRRWWWLPLGALVAGLVTLGVTLLLPPTYEAGTLVLFEASTLTLQSTPGSLLPDARLSDVENPQPQQVLPELALSEPIIGALFDAVGGGSAWRNRADLRDDLRVATANDPSLLRLTVRSGDAATAARVVELWATLFVSQTNALLGTRSSDAVTFIAAQLAEREAALREAESALLDFQAANEIPLLEAELAALSGGQGELVAEAARLNGLARDIAAYHAALDDDQGGDPLAAQQLGLLLLELRALGGSLPPQLQFDAAPPAGGRDALLAALDSLGALVAAMQAGNATQQTTLAPRVRTVQQALQAQSLERNRLQRDVDLAGETVAALSRRLTEERISSQDAFSGLRRTGPALIPVEPASPQPLLNSVIGALIGLAVTLALLLFGQWRALADPARRG